MKDYIKLIRVKHYVKNLIIFCPLLFSGQLFNRDYFLTCLLGTFAFCMVSSIVYIVNDYKDVEKDRQHPTKKNRPLASGAVSARGALFTLVGMAIAAIIGLALLGSTTGAVWIGVYFLANMAYSFGLKNVPIIDVVILASGFVIRVVFGGVITGIEISQWLYLVVVTGSLYMGLGKRRNELKHLTETRGVLKHYNISFLDKNMYVCLACADVFYALWTIESGNPGLVWTVPLFIVLLMSYSLDAEGDSDGDPVEVILHNRLLLGLAMLFLILVFVIIYS
jgi:4-hydroxybenzoate polyprenyltransferase